MRTLQELKNVKIGDMTSAERRLVTASAVGRLKAELESPEVQAHLRSVLGRVTMPVSPWVVDLIDPDGELRRSGRFDIEAVPVVEAGGEWTPKDGRFEFRVWAGRLFRKENDVAFYGGCQIKSAVVDSPIAREWLAARTW
jgi:hypothetical protein